MDLLVLWTGDPIGATLVFGGDELRYFGPERNPDPWPWFGTPRPPIPAPKPRGRPRRR